MRRDPNLIPLSHQHQHGLALSVLIDRGLKKDSSPENSARLARIVAEMVELELFAHFRIEEEVLFPAIRQSLGDEAIVDHLISQHREMERLVSEIASTDGESRRHRLVEFGNLLSRHIRVEERQLFEEIQANVGHFELAQLGKQIEEQIQSLCPSTQILPWQTE